ncbi:MAG TPA: aconitate hydratase, partial [bacterium]|nr:aconitate hydratase [bacterium]
PAPVKPPLEETLAGPVLIKVGDDISTDHIMPAGSEIVAHRSNIPRLAEYVFYRMDPTFSRRAKEAKGGFIVGGENYGQGSSREHAALAPMYLGVKGVIAKSFSRIHHANLINWGLIPMIFADPADYDGVAQGDALEIPGVRVVLEGTDAGFTVRNRTKGTQFLVTVDLNPRERIYILAGGKLSHVKTHPVRQAR